MFETLFHPAIWLPAALIVIGVIVFIVGNSRVQTAVRTTGLAIVGLAVLWGVVAYVVDTPVEKAVGRTKAICAAVEAADWKKLQTLVDSSTVIDGTDFRGNAAIADGTQRAAQLYGLKSIRILNTDAAVVQPNDDIAVTINTLLDGAQPSTAQFKFTYERRSDGVALTRITPLQIGGHPMDEITRLLH